jgi:hypothetical protein
MWSETECKTPAEYGPQCISTPPQPPSHSHTVTYVCMYVCTVHWEGGEGEGEQREGTVEGQ